MQTTTISTNIDNQINSVKTNKASVNVLTQSTNQASFNQLLSKEISSQKNTYTSSNQNYGANNNNNNKINNKAPSPAPTPSQPMQASKSSADTNVEKQSDGTKSTQQSEEDQTDQQANSTEQAQNAGAQLLALMGNLTPTAVKPANAKGSEDQSTTPVETTSLTVAAADSSITGTDSVLPFNDKELATAADITDTKKTPGLKISPDEDKLQKISTDVPADIKAKLESMQKASGDAAKKPVIQKTTAASDNTSDGTTGSTMSTSGIMAQTSVQHLPTIDASADANKKTDPVNNTANDAKTDLASDDADAAKNKVSVAAQQDNKAIDTKDIGVSKDVTSKETFAQQLSAAKVTESIQDKQTITPAPNVAAATTSNVTTTTPGVTSSDQIAPRVGVAGWDKAVGQKVLWMVGESMQSAELTLNPPDLGPLQVVLNVTNDQASANFFSAQPEVREALESALPRLRQMMSDAGVQLSGFSVNTQASNQGQGFAGQQQEQSNRQAIFNTRTANNLTSDPLPAPVQRASTKIGMVDTFV
ncbi:flagellar hook-length control protein FliK [Undibacterium sp. SXout7W]|uniref:flagellar hook-length control protein FliK n=1 Tax=Undibacterium sp. SXout7W TaxID=3413049 RepID=UPI003BF334E1